MMEEEVSRCWCVIHSLELSVRRGGDDKKKILTALLCLDEWFQCTEHGGSLFVDLHST